MNTFVLVLTFVFGGLVGDISFYQPVDSREDCEIALTAVLNDPGVFVRNGDKMSYDSVEGACVPALELDNSKIILQKSQ